MKKLRTGNLTLRRKYTFRIGDQAVVVAKKAFESDEHVICKALAFCLYKPRYPNLHIELKVEGRYRPDVAQVSDTGRPEFWAECGALGRKKIHKLIKKFRATHFAFFKWEADIDQFAAMVRKESKGVQRSAPLELILISKSPADYIGQDGIADISFRDCTIIGI